MPKQKQIKVTLPNFSGGVFNNKSDNALSFNAAKVAYNFGFESGALKSALTLAPLLPIEFPEGFKPARCFQYVFYNPNNSYRRADRLVIISNSKQLIELPIPSEGFAALSETGGVAAEMSDAAEFPLEAINYRLNNRDVLIMTFKNANMHLFDSAANPKLQATANTPKIQSMCVHYERLFAIIPGHKNAVWFSTELNPLNWSLSLNSAGFIEMLDERGELTKVLSFGGYVYIIREYGIARLTAHGNQTEFNLVQVYQSSGRIYENTVCICGDRIMFLAEDGLFVFDGVNTHRIGMGIEEMLKGQKNSRAVAAFYQGKYYLALKLNFFDDKKLMCEAEPGCINNAIVAIDLKTSSLSITRGYDVSAFSAVNENGESHLTACLNKSSTVYEILPYENQKFKNTLEKSFKTKITDFNAPGRIKVLKEIVINSKTDAQVVVYAGSTKGEAPVPSTINIKGSPLARRVRLNIVAETFAFEIKTCAPDAEISHLELLLTVR